MAAIPKNAFPAITFNIFNSKPNERGVILMINAKSLKLILPSLVVSNHFNFWFGFFKQVSKCLTFLFLLENDEWFLFLLDLMFPLDKLWILGITIPFTYVNNCWQSFRVTVYVYFTMYALCWWTHLLMFHGFK